MPLWLVPDRTWRRQGVRSECCHAWQRRVVWLVVREVGMGLTLSPVGSAMSTESLPQAIATCHFSVSVQPLGYSDVSLFCVRADTMWPFSCFRLLTSCSKSSLVFFYFFFFVQCFCAVGTSVVRDNPLLRLRQRLRAARGAAGTPSWSAHKAWPVAGSPYLRTAGPVIQPSPGSVTHAP